MKSPSVRTWSTFGLSLAGLLYIHYGFVRPDWQGIHSPGAMVPFLAVLLGLHFLYLWTLQSQRGPNEVRWQMAMGMLLRVAVLFCLPNLSDDFYRFVWDGQMTLDGFDPLAWTPREWMAQSGMAGGESEALYRQLYPLLNSQDYYTVYPPVLQLVFAGAVALGGKGILGPVVLMKVVVLAAEWGSILLLRRLLIRWQKPNWWVLVYALNPLVIVELTGNLHFEAVMVFFVLLAVYLLSKGRWVTASVSLGAAISTKLLPFVVFPFLVRRLGWWRAIASGGIAVLVTAVLFRVCFEPDHLPHFMESIRLYFQAFEFNGNIYYLGRWLLGEHGYWMNRVLPWLVMGTILWWAWRSKDKSWAGLPFWLLLAFGLYQLAQPVIHPWYIAPLIAYAALTRYRFPVVWGMLIPFTYLTYASPSFREPLWVLLGEYLLLFAFIAYEWQFRGGALSLEEWVHSKPRLKNWLRKTLPARMAIKLDRIAACIPEGHRVLDLGTGNGALCHELNKKGYAVTPVDVKDISLFEEVRPQIYDGQRLPFSEASFDTVQLITVLHHTPDPERVLDEAIRVSGQQILVMEDVYSNWFQKQLTFFTDSLVNLEFAGHPHTNMTDSEWQQLFARKGLRLVHRQSFRTLVFFRQVIYVLEKS